MCNNCGNTGCSGNCLQVPVGDQGLQGNPACLAIPIAAAGVGVNSASYVTVGAVVIGNNICTPFTAFAMNISVHTGTVGSARLYFVPISGSPVVLMEDINITSTSGGNIQYELMYNNIPLNIIPATAGTLFLQVLNQTGGGANVTFIQAATLYYQPVNP